MPSRCKITLGDVFPADSANITLPYTNFVKTKLEFNSY